MLIAFFAFSTALAVVARVLWGGLAGVGTTAVCAATIAFFLMPPVLSFRVSETRDLIALAVFGTAGLVLAQSPRSRRRLRLAGVEPSKEASTIPPHPESDLHDVVEQLMASDLGMRLRKLGFAVPDGGLTLPCNQAEASRILFDVSALASETPGIQHLSIYAAQFPGVRRITVAAHLVWPPPLGMVLTIGKRDEDCSQIEFPGWPGNWKAWYFENCCHRVFQVSVTRKSS